MTVKDRCEKKMPGYVWVLFFALVCLWVIFAKTNDVRAAESGTSGTCSWEIDDDGVLTISPTDGVSGTMDSYISGDGPWYSYRKQIKKVVVKPGVKAGTGCYQLFYYFSKCTEIDLTNLDTSNVTDMNSMFYCCSSLTNLDVSGFDTNKVTNMKYMFASCSNLTGLDVSGLNTANVTNMSHMFQSCSGLTSLDVSEFDTDNVTDMSCMFFNCPNLTSLNLSGWNTSKVTKMSGMFYKCSSLTSLDVSGFDTSKVTSMDSMFYKCSGLASLDVSGFNTGNVTNTSNMFDGCSGLTNLDVSEFDTSSVTNMSNMFYNCSNLATVNLSADFSFKGKNISSTSSQATLPTPSGAGYTGKWIKDDESTGPYTPAELRDNYNGATMSGTWVWEEVPTKYTLIFTADEGVSGSMPNVKAVAAEDFTIPENKFYQFGKDFDHWEVVTETRAVGDTYEDMATIPANKYAIGDKITLKAIMKDADTSYTIENGTFDFYLRANEKATFKNIPAGTAYQVYEETPDGWVLVDQSNVSGTIEPLKTSRAQFVNKYQPDVTTVQFTGTKKLDGYAVPEGAYSFELYEEGKDEPIETVATKDGGFVQFSVIEYTQEDVGDHTYHIKEVNPNDDAIDWDKHEETITVNVKDNGDGTLSAKAIYDSDGIVFNNKTKPGMLKITKRTNIKTPANQNDKFTFNITFNNEKGQPISDDIYWYSEGVNRQDTAQN